MYTQSRKEISHRGEIASPDNKAQRLRTIIQLGLPITGGMLSQSLINLVDTAMVGHLGEDALAAIGAANYAMFICLALISGLSVAVQSRVAHHYGAGRRTHLLEPVGTGVQSVLWLGVPLTLFLYLMTPLIIASFRLDGAVAVLAENYFSIRILSLPAAMLMLTFRGFWNGCHSPWIFLRILVAIHIFNALASYGLIFGFNNFAFGLIPEMRSLPGFGLSGAAAGTLIAMYSGALLNVISLTRFARHRNLSSNRTTGKHLLPLFRQAWPDSAQQVLFAFGTATLFWLIAGLGQEAMAISHILINISLLLILPGIGLGMAATTLINQALGSGDKEQAWRWGWDVVMVTVGLLCLLSLPLLLFPAQVLRLFVADNLSLIEQGALPLRLAGLGIILESAALVLTQALLGTGSNRTVLQIRFTTLWLVALPLSWFVSHTLGWGLTAIWCIQVLQRLLTSLACIITWQRRNWHS